MTELEQRLRTIVTEKEEKLLPENLKKGITLLGVEGILETGLTEQIFEDTELTLENTIENAPIKNFTIAGRSRQKGTPSLDTAVPVENQIAGNTYTIYVNNEDNTLNQSYSMQLTDTIKGRSTVRDTFMDDGLHIRMGEIIYDGSDDEEWKMWTLNDDVVERFYINAEAHLFGGYSMCDKLQYIDNNSATEHFRNSSNTMEDGSKKYNQLLVYINKSRLETVDVTGFKTYLTSNPLTFTTALQEEIIIPYNTSQQATYDTLKNMKTYGGITKITNSFSSNGPMFSGSYYTLTNSIDTSDATATANDIALGKTAYVNGEKITGTYEPNYEELGTVTPEEYTEAQTQISDLFGEEETE